MKSKMLLAAVFFLAAFATPGRAQECQTNCQAVTILEGHNYPDMMDVSGINYSDAMILFNASSAFPALPPPGLPTGVTGTVVDPNGIPYAGATLKVSLTPTTSGQLFWTGGSQAQCVAANAGSAPCNIPFTPPNAPIELDSTGSFTTSLYPNGQITHAGPQWQFQININAPGPLGVGPVTFTVPITIVGANQNVSVTLTAAAPSLIAFTLGGATSFSAITGGTNITAAMVVGTGASLAASGTGTIAATSCTGTAAACGSAGSIAGGCPNPGTVSVQPTGNYNFSPCTYGAWIDTQIVKDGVGNGTGTVTSVSGFFNCAADVGKTAYVYQIGSSGVIEDGPVLIDVCNSATSIHLAAGSVPVGVGYGIEWGHPDVTAINAMDTAASALNQICPHFSFPAGQYMIPTVPFTSQNTTWCEGGGLEGIQQAPDVGGSGINTTILFFTPNFAYTGCAGTPSAACLGLLNTTWHDFQINSAGYTTATATAYTMMLLESPGGCTNVLIGGLQANSGSIAYRANGPTIALNCQTYDMTGYAFYCNGSEVQIFGGFYQDTFGIYAGAGCGSIGIHNVGGVGIGNVTNQTSLDLEGGPGNVMEVFGEPGSNQQGYIKCGTTGNTLYLHNESATYSLAFPTVNIQSGCKVVSENSKFTNTGGANSVGGDGNAASTFVDKGGNSYPQGFQPFAAGSTGVIYSAPVPPVVGQISCTAATCAAGATTIVTSQAADAQYKLEATVACTGTVATATAIMTLKYTDPSNTVQTLTVPTALCTTLGANSVATLTTVVRAKASTAIQYSVAQANSPTFEASVSVTQQNVY